MEVPSASVFRAVLSGDFKSLLDVKESDIIPFLPALVRFALCRCPPQQTSSSWSNARTVAHKIISEIEAANQIAAYLDVDFKEIEVDAQKLRRLKDKMSQAGDSSGSRVHNVLVSSLQFGLIVEFEKANTTRKFRLLISELLRIMDQLDAPFKFDTSELFECSVITEEISNMISVVSAELPSLLPITELSEVLLRLHKGPHLLCRLLANNPDSFNRVVRKLLLNGEAQDEVSISGRCRTKALRMLCSLHPPVMTSIQSLAVDNLKHPTLALFLALEAANSPPTNIGIDKDEYKQEGSTFIPFLYNLIVKGDKPTKSWITQYLKLSQHKYRRRSGTALSMLRQHLIRQVSCYLQDNLTREGKVVEDDAKMSMDEQDSDVDSDSGNISDNAISSKVIGQGVLSEEKLAKSTMELVDQMEIEISDKDVVVEEMDTATITTSNLTTEIKMESSEPLELFTGRQKTDEEVLAVTLLIKIYCGLKVHGLFFNTDESAAMFRLLTGTSPPFSEAGVKFVEAAFSILLACPFLISPPGRSEIVIQWFKWLLENQHLFDRQCGGHSYGELLLLTAIHFHDNKRTQIEELISDTIGLEIKNVPRTGDFGEIRDLFLQVFSERVVCSQAVSVSCTEQLNANITGFLPVNCVMQLLKAKSFSKHNVPLKEWLYKQLCKATSPIHPTLPPLVEEYVSSVVLGPNSGQNARNSLYAAVPTMRHQEFSEEEIMRVFGEDKCSTTAQLLFLYYLLLYHDTYLSNLRMLVTPQGELPHSYSPHVIHFIPVKKLLLQCTKEQALYAPLYPQLIKLLVTHLPHLCLVQDWMEQEEKENCSLQSAPLVLMIPKVKLTLALVKKVLATIQSNPSRALVVLQQLAGLPPGQLAVYHSLITEVLPNLLDSAIPRRLLNLYLQIWKDLSVMVSRRLWLDTVDALRLKGKGLKAPKQCSHEDLYQNPLMIILNSDTRVFRCPPVFEILLHVLAAYLAASRVWFSEHAHVQKCVSLATKDANPTILQEREELRDVIIATQESAVVQLLLELCLPTEEDQATATFGDHLSVLEEIKSLVCSHLHQMFIFDPNLTKLVHYQGYPSELLPIVVQGIPSMHICSDFIPELLAHKDRSKQQFAIQLGIHVTHQYPLAKLMGLAQQIITKLTTLVNEIPKESLDAFFTPLFPSIVLLCQTFPPLAQEVTNFLLHLGRVVSSSTQCEPVNIRSLDKLTDYSRDEISRYINTAWQDKKINKETGDEEGMIKRIKDTFLQLVDTAVLKL